MSDGSVRHGTLAEAAAETGACIPVEKSAHYLKFYEELLGSKRDAPLRIVELGIHRGGSTILFARYFYAARILSVDIRKPPRALYKWLRKNAADNRVSIAIGSQDDPRFLRAAIEAHFGAGPVDVVFDDASHVYGPTQASYETLFYERLRPGGWYCIEDWGCGYWPAWADGHPDGRHGLPRFVKERIDEVAMSDRTKEYHGARALPVGREQASPIARLLIVPGIVAIKKAPGARSQEDRRVS